LNQCINSVQEYSSIDATMTDSEFSLFTPADPIGKRRTWALGRFPRENTKPEKTRSPQRKENFRKKPAFAPPTGEWISLSEVKLSSGKVVTAWAVEGDCDADAIRSNAFSMEWPPKSGKMQEFPEVDRAAWFTLPAANEKIHPAQQEFLVRLAAIVRENQSG
jgi:predicted NUDIX family NTP pyrophosphohydrolase